MKFWTMLVGVAVAAVLVVGISAQEKKEEAKPIDIKGTMVCGKCTLKETKACCNVVEVKEGDKTVKYYLSPADGGNKAKYHSKVCPAGSELEVTVKGKATKDKDGKFIVEKDAEVTVK